MEINISQPDEYRGIIQMIGQFWEHSEFKRFQEYSNQFIDKGIKHIVVDLSRVSFMSNQGIGLLVTVFSEVKKQGGELILFRPKGCVKEVLEISGLDKPIRITYSEKELA